MKRILFFLIAFGLTVPFYYDAVAASDVYVYPARGQSPQQMEKDKAECYRWAVGQTGFDPAAPPRPAPPPPQAQPQGGVISGALTGAALGAIGGAIAGDAGKGAAIGAATGGLFGGIRRHRQESYQRQQYDEYHRQEAARFSHMKQQYDRAYRACMTGRGYTVN